MLPKTRAPVRPLSGLLIRKRCTELTESVGRLSTTLECTLPLPDLESAFSSRPGGPVKKDGFMPEARESNAPLPYGKPVHQTIVEIINSMSEALGRSPGRAKPRKRKCLRLPVPEVLSGRSRGFLPRETIRASRKEEDVSERIHADNMLSIKTHLADVDSCLEMIEFVNEYILGEKGEKQPRSPGLTQKALALLLG